MNDKTKKLIVYVLVPVLVILLALLVVLTRPIAAVSPLIESSQNVSEIDGQNQGTVNENPLQGQNTDQDETELLVPIVAEAHPNILGRLCIVLDDTGNNLESVRSFLDLEMPLTFAILPALKYSQQAAQLMALHKREYIIHQPMEALGQGDPGPGAIYNTMSEEEMIDVLERNYAEQPEALGINNHMGSAVTANLKSMDIICHWLKSKGLFFLDSYTIADSQASQAAEKYGMEILRRDIFLDNDKDYDSIKTMVEKSMDLAVKNKKIIAIGHVTSGELSKVLKDLKEEFTKRGIELVSLSSYRKLK